MPCSFSRGDLADAPQALDRQRVQERELAVGRHDEQPVGLGDAARDLGEELRPATPTVIGKPDLRRARRAQAHGDLASACPRAARMPAHVEERLVDRQPLDERRRVLEDAEHRLARLRVRRHARRTTIASRAQAPRLPAAHRRAHAERLRLVARGEHDAAADDHRAAAQARVVPLLDRRVEGVEVGVQDRRLVLVHEHMFAQSAAVRIGSALTEPGLPAEARRLEDEAIEAGEETAKGRELRAQAAALRVRALGERVYPVLVCGQCFTVTGWLSA